MCAIPCACALDVLAGVGQGPLDAPGNLRFQIAFQRRDFPVDFSCPGERPGIHFGDHVISLCAASFGLVGEASGKRLGQRFKTRPQFGSGGGAPAFFAILALAVAVLRLAVVLPAASAFVFALSSASCLRTDRTRSDSIGLFYGGCHPRRLRDVGRSARAMSGHLREAFCGRLAEISQLRVEIIR